MNDNLKLGTYTDRVILGNDLITHLEEKFFIVCVGTDRSTGDSLAPLVGTMLREQGYENVIGTLHVPVHATNIEERLKEIPEGVQVLAIDSCLGKSDSIGKIFLEKGGLRAGKALDKDLPIVGDYHLKAVVNINSHEPVINFSILQNTRFSLVYDMAKTIAVAIQIALPLEGGLYLVEEETIN